MLLAVSRPASTIRRMTSGCTGLSWYVRTANTVRAASKTSIACLPFGTKSMWVDLHVDIQDHSHFSVNPGLVASHLDTSCPQKSRYPEHTEARLETPRNA